MLSGLIGLLNRQVEELFEKLLIYKIQPLSSRIVALDRKYKDDINLQRCGLDDAN